MELAQLEHFLAVAEDCSFTRAAQRMCRTQPAISQSIKKLEDELGAVLFTRDQHDIALTDAGKALAVYARKMIATRNKAARSVGALKHLSSGTLTIAAHETAAAYLLPVALRPYAQMFPDITVGIFRSRPADIPRQVLDRDRDIGFVEDDPGFRELKCVPVHADEMMVIASPAHPLALRKALTVSDLDGVPLIVHRRCGATEETILRWLGDHGVRCRIAAEVGSLDNVKSLVQEEVGVAIVPGISVTRDLATGTLVRLHVPELRMTNRSSMIYRAIGPRSAAAAAFIDIIRNFNWALPAVIRQIRRPA